MMEKKYDHQIQQARIKKIWHDKAVYHLTDSDIATRPLFSVDTPPPTVSGTLHIGHIFSYTHTDLIARFKRMSGFAVFYPFGSDGNGLPTERFVEKKCGVTAFSLGRSAFIELCLKEMINVEHTFQELFQSIGLSIDWHHTYSTIDSHTRAISQQSFIDLYHKKYAYRKMEPALYCTSCYTSVAQAELEDIEKETLLSTISFLAEDGTPLSIATTRPEFLAGCVALFYNPKDARYVHLKGKYATVPLYGIRVPILPEESISLDKGTGLVMCCAFGDSSDVQWIQKHELSFNHILQKDGRFLSHLAYVGGLKVKPARIAILEELKNSGHIVEQKSITHAVNIHERCKNEIEFLQLSQWFIDIKSHKNSFIEMGNRVTWYPAYMKSRYDNWVEHVKWDWCISRQRFFGIPFPCWHCQSCHTVIMAESDMLPIDPQETAYHKPCPSCGSSDIVADTDVMDTWNTSSLTPFILEQLYKKAYPEATQSLVPMSMRPQAHDIIRTWAFDTIVKSWMHNNDIPWHDIVISGHVLSTEKQKISKSQGNNPLEPENLLKTYPADVIRYWTAGAQLGTDTAFSENQFKIGQRLLVKLWNASLFVHEHGQEQELLRPENALNKWIMHQASITFNRYKKSFNEYDFHKALESIERFFWNDWCDNYLELIKDQFFNPDNYTADHIRETRAVLYRVGYELIQWYAPFLPYITEAIYQDIYNKGNNKDSLHQTVFVSAEHEHSYPDAVETVAVLLAAVQHIRKLKTDAALSLKTDIASVTLYALPKERSCLASIEHIFRGVARAAHVYYTDTQVKTELVNAADTYTITINLENAHE